MGLSYFIPFGICNWFLGAHLVREGHEIPNHQALEDSKYMQKEKERRVEPNLSKMGPKKHPGTKFCCCLEKKLVACFLFFQKSRNFLSKEVFFFQKFIPRASGTAWWMATALFFSFDRNCWVTRWPPSIRPRRFLGINLPQLRYVFVWPFDP